MRRVVVLILLTACAVVPLPLRAAQDPVDQQAFADGLYGRKLYDMAIQEYLRIIREAPDYPALDVVLFRTAEAYRYLDSSPAAQRFYSRVISEFPESPYRFKSEFRRAELFLTAGDYGEAVNRFRSLLDRKPPDDLAASSQYYLGFALRRMAMTGEGERVLSQLLDRYPDSPYAAFACLELAELYREQKKAPADLAKLYRRAAESGPSDRVRAEGLFQLADLAYTSGQFAEASEAYSKLLDRHASDQRAVSARFPAAWSFYHTRQFDRALALADDALANADQRPEDWLYLRANALRQKGDTAAAATAYDRLLQEGKNDRLAAAASYERALVAFRDKDFKKVISLLTAADLDDRVREDAHWLLAEANREQGHIVEAESGYMRILKDFPRGSKAPESAYQLASLKMRREAWADAAAAFANLASSWPLSERAPSALYAAGTCLARAEDYEGAVEAWLTLLEHFSDHPQAADARYQCAVAEMQLDRKEAADRSFQAFLKDHKNDPKALDARYWRAVLAEQRGDAAAGERMLREVLAAQPAPELASKARFRLAAALQKQGREEEAADLIQSLMGQPEGPKLPPALVEWLSRHRLDQKKYEAAGEAGDYLVRSSGDTVWAQIGWYLVGLSRERQQHFNEAEQAYRNALKVAAQSPEGVHAALNLGWLLLESGKAAEAVPFLERAGEEASDPQLGQVRARAYFGLGKAAELEQDWHQANRFFMSVAILYDDPQLAPEALYKAATALGKIGKSMEQRRTLAELLERYPDSSWAQKVKKP